MHVRMVALVVVSISSVAFAGEMNGPMSSRKPPEHQAQTSGAQPSAAAGGTPFNAEALFATSCGWCHHNGGREAGKGPQLMGTTLSDGEIVRRIVAGIPGKMPAFSTTFNDEQLLAIVKYIRELKPK